MEVLDLKVSVACDFFRNLDNEEIKRGAFGYPEPLLILLRSLYGDDVIVAPGIAIVGGYTYELPEWANEFMADVISEQVQYGYVTYWWCADRLYWGI